MDSTNLRNIYINKIIVEETFNQAYSSLQSSIGSLQSIGRSFWVIKKRWDIFSRMSVQCSKTNWRDNSCIFAWQSNIWMNLEDDTMFEQHPNYIPQNEFFNNFNRDNKWKLEKSIYKRKFSTTKGNYQPHC